MKGEAAPNTVELAARGIYLMNGGRKEDLEEMNYDDIQLIYIAYNAYQTSLVNRITENIVKLFGGE